MNALMDVFLSLLLVFDQDSRTFVPLFTSPFSIISSLPCQRYSCLLAKTNYRIMLAFQ